MRTMDEVSADKLRGGFYSPDVLVGMCLDRASALLEGREALRVLEPAAGDGAFLRGLARSDLRTRVGHVVAIELIDAEAAKARAVLEQNELPGEVVHGNVLEWARADRSDVDVVLANPPYVRFQFISESDKQYARAVSAELGVAGRAVSNLWIPVLLLALSKLRDGGVFSVILPTEFLTGISASAVRNWLLAHATDLTIDLFKPGSFPAVLQEVLVLSGHRRTTAGAGAQDVTFHDHNGGTHSWTHTVRPGTGTWTAYLLSPAQNAAYREASILTGFRRLGDVARMTVSTVTGANGYFCVDSRTLDEYDLHRWAIPIVQRSRHVPGLRMTNAEHAALSEAGEVAWMLSFSADAPSPADHAGARRYLGKGLAQGIDQRFKCRIRTPWYRVPVVPAGTLLLSKRSNAYPRLQANHAGLVTTDTIYRGQVLPGVEVDTDDLVTTFHNSLTLLSAEIEGRSFGGGVLELVPSEIGSLRVPIVPGAGTELGRLDRVARARKAGNSTDAIIEATDALLAERLPGLDDQTLSLIAEARQVLLSRRMQRSGSGIYD